MKRVIIICGFIYFTSILYADSILAGIPFYVKMQQDSKQNEISLILKGQVDKVFLKEVDARIGSQIGEFTTITIPLSNIDRLSQLKQLAFYPSKPDAPLLEDSTSDLMIGSNYVGCNADAAQEMGYDGSDVIVAILDFYPLNWKHEDFYETSWENDDLRILYIWNQQDDTGPHPDGFDYGTEYSKSDLMNDDGPVINSGNHGTQCTGIAAGDGSASGAGNPRRGIADGAEIIYVHKIWESSNSIDAIAYFQSKADELERPIVVSYSGGSRYGFPDGSEPFSQAVNTFCEEGRLISIAAGNYYTTTNHAKGISTFDEPITDIIFEINNYTNSGSGQYDDYIDAVFYFKEGDNFDVMVTSPSADVFETTVNEDDESFATSNGTLYIFHNDDSSIEVVVTDESGAVLIGDSWTIALTPPDGTYDDEGGKWSAWLVEHNIQADFTTYNTAESTLNIYAAADECIAVAGHSKYNGIIYSGSSAGLTMDDRQKPEISAPTNAYSCTNSSSTSYGSLGGTSGAAPHVAGTLALMLQVNSELTVDDARTLLTDYAFTDEQTDDYGEEPNIRFGFGKLNSFRSTVPQLPAPLSIFLEIINNGEDAKISWDNDGFIYRVYSNEDPYAEFPGASWILETTIEDDSEYIIPISADKRFFTVTAD